MDIAGLALNVFNHKNTKIVSLIFQFYNALQYIMVPVNMKLDMVFRFGKSASIIRL